MYLNSEKNITKVEKFLSDLKWITKKWKLAKKNDDKTHCIGSQLQSVFKIIFIENSTLEHFYSYMVL